MLNGLVRRGPSKYNPEGRGPSGRVVENPEVEVRNRGSGMNQLEFYKNPSFMSYVPGFHKLMGLAKPKGSKRDSRGREGNFFLFNAKALQNLKEFF